VVICLLARDFLSGERRNICVGRSLWQLRVHPWSEPVSVEQKNTVEPWWSAIDYVKASGGTLVVSSQ
jgi:hypothetical protein